MGAHVARTARLGLIVNPIAGMGGPVALKGTDDRVERARELGAQPVAHDRAVRLLTRLAAKLSQPRVLTCSGPMGERACLEAGIDHEVVHQVQAPTTAEDTRRAARRLEEAGVDLLCFLGGDGTALDVAEAIGTRVPCLGVPSGVKMNSAVFAQTPEAGAEVVAHFLAGRTRAREAEVVEVDEALVRQGRLEVAHLSSLLVPEDPAVAPGKAEPGGTVEGVVEAIEDLATPGATLVLGAGSTLHAVKQALVGAGSLLGVDVVEIGPEGSASLVARDATAAQLEQVPEDAWIVVSPIGGQGFVFGRGNQQLTPALLARLGWQRVVVVATPDKLAGLGALRADTGDPALDQQAPDHLQVVTGPGFRRMLRLDTGVP